METINISNGYQYLNRVPSTRSYRISNLSRFTSVDIYLDGDPATPQERVLGSSRLKHRIFPGGWVVFNRETEKLGISPDGWGSELTGAWSPVMAPDLNVPVQVEEFDELFPYATFDPPMSVIGSWDSVYAKGATSKLLKFSQLDPTIRLPQVKEKAILFVNLSSEGFGADCFNYLKTQEAYALNNTPAGTDNFFQQRYPFGEYQDLFNDDSLDSGFNSTTHATRILFKPFWRLADLMIFTTDGAVTTQAFTGGLYYVKLPHEEKTKQYLRSFAVAFGVTDKIYRIPTYHLDSVTLAWKQSACTAAGSIVVKHYSAGGTLLATDTQATATGTEGILTITPKASFIDIDIIAGTVSGALTIEAWLNKSVSLA